MYKNIFTIDGLNYPHIAYTSGRLWNGWATPYFELVEALIAMEIEDFIWEYDTYHYQDECLDRMQTVEEIQKQLKDFNTLKQAIKIFYNDDLTEELKFEKLGGILRV